MDNNELKKPAVFSVETDEKNDRIITYKGKEIKIDPNPCGKIISDEPISPIDLLAEIGEDYEGIDEDISWEEFEEKFPDIWTYPLTDMDECLFNNSKAAIVRFFDQTKEGGSTFRVCQVEE